MKKHTILFLAANPTEMTRLALDAEARAVQIELERSGYRDCFDLQTRWAVQPLDLLRELRRLKPTVVHFSGHGGQRSTGTAGLDRPANRDVNLDADPGGPQLLHGLFFQGADGRAQLVTAQALQDTFGAAGASVQLVVLSACHSDLQVDALRTHVDCVVAMTGAVNDDAARHFSTGFYGGLGDGESIASAFRQGCAAISLEGLPDRDRPQLRVRDGVDATKLVLGAAKNQADPHEAKTAAPAAAQVTREELLTRLSGLLPSQFEAVLFRTRVPIEHLSAASAAQAMRAIEAIRYFEQRNELEALARIVEEVATPGNAAGAGPAGPARAS